MTSWIEKQLKLRDLKRIFNALKGELKDNPVLYDFIETVLIQKLADELIDKLIKDDDFKVILKKLLDKIVEELEDE